MNNAANTHATLPEGTPPVASPCIRHCTLNDQDVCVGCGRTLADIVGWTKMSEAEKALCVARAAERVRSGRWLP
ncbi:MAG: DUF1289 domain-containing protein [Burkholderiales bacterium]|nr:DUF1289 domain-containing protein [Burkholderiales bacterium]